MTKEQQIKIQRCIDEFYSNRPQVRDELGAALQVLYEAEPVKHGRWVRKESKRCYWFECSECGYPPPLDKFKREWFSNYCPNCGAQIDEVEE